MTPKKPNAISGLRRGLGQAAEHVPMTDDEAAAFIEGTTPAQVRVREMLKPPRPPKDVRFTLDLSEDRHAFLKRFAEESGAGVRASQVMRALLDELAEGPNLAARVRSRIWAARK
jgi:uncharacterized protein (UPF0147 family)